MLRSKVGLLLWSGRRVGVGDGCGVGGGVICFGGVGKSQVGVASQSVCTDNCCCFGGGGGLMTGAVDTDTEC